MLSNPNQVVVSPARPSMVAVQGMTIHHRDFPEVRGEGQSPEEAVTRLTDLLTQTLDSAPSEWRREKIERAIQDVQAFAHRDEL